MRRATPDAAGIPVALYGFTMQCGQCGHRIVILDSFAPINLPGWDPRRVVPAGFGAALLAADAALTTATRDELLIGAPAPVDLNGEPVAMNTCGYCHTSITVDMRTEAEIEEDVDYFYELQQTAMPLELFRAAEADGGLVGPCIIEGGPRVVSTAAKLAL